MYQASNQPQLPVPADGWDPKTLNHSLPHGNDVWPKVSLPINLPPDAAERVVVEFRMLMQSRLGRTPLHNFAYNMLSINYFENQMFFEWIQRAVDFAEYLIVAQGNYPDNAAKKAAEKLYFAALATFAAQFPQLQQTIDQGMLNDLALYSREFEDIVKDLQVFRARGRQQPMGAGGWQPPQQGWSQPQQLPPIGQSFTNRQIPVHSAMAMAPTPYNPTSSFQTGFSAPQGQTASQGKGRYADEPVVAPKPSQTWHAGGNTQQPNVIRPVVAPGRPAQAVVIDTNLPIPLTVEDVVVDPKYYIPHGFVVDEGRPYDLIHNPGGVEIRPAHLSHLEKWVRTSSDLQPYALGYDPGRFVLFHVKWPDGVIQDKIVEWTDDMDYMKHETQDALRSIHLKTEGKVVVNTQKILGVEAEPVSVEELKKTLDQNLITVEELSPVIVEGVYSNSTDMENEQAVRVDIIELLGLAKDTPVIPAHEYSSAKAYPLDISKECSKALMQLQHCQTMVQLAVSLETLANQGILPRRYYRFLDERLTSAINQIVAENLSIEQLTIDSFVGDVYDMLGIITNKRKMPEVVQVINSQTRAFVARWLNFLKTETAGEDRPEQFAVMDEYVNLQTGWTIDEIGSVNLTKKPVLLSRATHPKLAEVIDSLLRRKRDANELSGRSVRLITADGTYLEVLRGWLVEGAILIKRLN